MDILDAIRRKRAVRQYQPTPIPEEVVIALASAGRRAQSSKNLQPWRFIAVVTREKLHSLATTGKYAYHMANAPLALFIATPDPKGDPSILFDAGQAAAYMQLAGISFGIGSCIIKIHYVEEAGRLLRLPVGYEVNFAIVFGYPSDPEILSRKLVGSGREDLKSMLYREQWPG